MKNEYCDYLLKKNLVNLYDIIDTTFVTRRFKDEKIGAKHNIVPTLLTRCDCLGVTVMEKNKLRIRKLTPKECWRLMGFKDENFEKARKVNSDAQLYKQAGNSIVVNVLEEIFRQMV